MPYLCPANNKNYKGTMEKIKVSQDTLYSYLTEHSVKLVRLAELVGISGASMTSCFKHQITVETAARLRQRP